jgi:hypothetical protein
VLILYATTIFLGASLLFLVQPMFARMVLPLLGGSPSVWNTALVFYQTALLAGYVYAHVATAALGIRRQAALHLAVVALPLLVLPLGIPAGWTPPRSENPIPWLLALLVVSVGLPFFVVSSSSPLLQKWLTGTTHGAAADPYFLYAASNLGSLLALLAYPLVVEPYLRLPDQSRLWTLGYALLALLALGCALAVWREPASARLPEARPPGSTDPPPGIAQRLRWVLLAFVPSSLMLSVTTHLSADIAAIPLLWVIPLVVYLLTFILVFARKPPISHRLMVEALPITMLPLVMVLVSRATGPLALVIPPHLLTLFVAGMVCHGRLAADRPPPRHLTEFYLWISVGGALGGVATALIAPVLFTSVAEYPLMLVLACLLAARPHPAPESRRARILDVALPAALGLLALASIRAVQAGDSPATRAHIGLVFGGLVLLCFTFSRRPLRFGLGIGAILLAATTYQGEEGRLLYAERTFFGVHRVTLDPAGRYRLLLHGTTLHGMQSLDPARRQEPLAYYSADGPVAQVFAAFRAGDAPRSVAVVGLGTGSIACHGARDQRWRFYEIDPAVERIARDPRHFTFLHDCPPRVEVVLGDARLALETARERYGLIVLDAYSSDAPPVHLLTREALRLYLERLAPHGILAFNISNRHLDLEPVLGALARDAGLLCLVQDDAVDTEAERARGKLPSKWGAMAREAGDLGSLATDPGWQPPRLEPPAGVWTDDYSSIVRVFRWRAARPGTAAPPVVN